jgi:hypothetical protein
MWERGMIRKRDDGTRNKGGPVRAQEKEKEYSYVVQ